ncbi:MAG: bifunctional nuclease domain-containing protein [Bacteroidales bacterium]
MAEEKIPLQVLGISFGHSLTGAYALVLGESLGRRRIPIAIGSFEAHAISLLLEEIQSQQPPLTHELLAQVVDLFDIQVQEVNIYAYEQGFFKTQIVLSSKLRTKVLEARTSDAVVLALRFACPIFTNAAVLDDVGISVEFCESKNAHNSFTQLHKLSIKSIRELQTLLARAVELENYEEAALLRDAIAKKG